jgi:DinB superfamily
MSAWRAFVAELAQRLERSLDQVRARLRTSPGGLAHRTRSTAWSNLEIGEHVVLVNRYLLILADKIAEKSRRRRARGELPPAAPSRIDHLEKLASSEFEWAAPAHMVPRGNASVSEIDAGLREQFERCAALLAEMPDGEGSLHRIRMSAVGEDARLDLYQFLAVVALHAERHARAMRRNEESFAGRADQPR